MTVIEKLHPGYIVDHKGHKTAVVLPYNEYNELLEDIGDLAVAAERRYEPTIPHEDVLKDLKENGYL